MKGKLFVCIYSVILLGLFGVCCYLMSTVNPPRLPDTETRRYHVVADMDYKEARIPRDNPDYGLEKIPDGVDADEFRKQLMATVNKYEVRTEPYERGQPVVPPIWPDKDVERNIDRRKELTSKELETSSAVKGHRRSVNDKDKKLKESPRSILLKIVDDSGHKKIEIKFISEENKEKTKKLRKNRSPNQLKTNVSEIANINKSIQYESDDNVNEEVIKIKANDIILLDIVDDSEILLNNSDLFDTNSTEDIQNFVNLTTKNETKLVKLEEPDKKLKELNLTNTYSFNLLFNNDNGSVDSGNLNSEDNSSIPITTRNIVKSTSSEAKKL